MKRVRSGRDRKWEEKREEVPYQPRPEKEASAEEKTFITLSSGFYREKGVLLWIAEKPMPGEQVPGHILGSSIKQ